MIRVTKTCDYSIRGRAAQLPPAGPRVYLLRVLKFSTMPAQSLAPRARFNVVLRYISGKGRSISHRHHQQLPLRRLFCPVSTVGCSTAPARCPPFKSCPPPAAPRVALNRRGLHSKPYLNLGKCRRPVYPIPFPSFPPAPGGESLCGDIATRVGTSLLVLGTRLWPVEDGVADPPPGAPQPRSATRM